jgi:hypothetical protein
MSNRRYAAGIFVAATIAVVGIRWHAGRAPYHAAEDAAALMADTWIATAAIQATGTNSLESTPTFGSGTGAINPAYRPSSLTVATSFLAPSNVVTSARLRVYLIKVAETLKRHLHNATVTYPAGGWVLNGAHWLADPWPSTSNYLTCVAAYDPAIAIGTTSAVWQYYPRTYTLLPPSAYTAAVTTIDTRAIIPAQATVYRNFDDALPSLTNAPAIDLIYGAASSASRLSTFDPFPGHAGNWWTRLGHGTNIYLWPTLNTPTNDPNSAPYTLNHVATTNTLNELLRVTSALTQSIHIASASYLPTFTAERLVSTRFSAETNSSPSFEFSAATPQLYTDYSSAAITAAIATQSVVISTNVALAAPVAGAGTILRAVTHLGTEGTFTSTNPTTTYAAYAKWAATINTYSNITATWPAAQTFTLGLVGRIRIYACFARDPVVIPLDYLNSIFILWRTDTYASNVIITPDASTQDLYDLDSLQTPYTLSPWPLLDTGTPATHGSIAISASTTPHPRDFILNPIVDISNPTSYPAFNLGDSAFDLSLLSAAQSFSAAYDYEYTFNSGTTNAITITSHAYNHSLRLHAIITVVDWSFPQHAITNSATLYTPAWLTNVPPEAP